MSTCRYCGSQHVGARCEACDRRRELAHEHYAICQTNQCGHWGTDVFGRTGCLLASKPCDIFAELLRGESCKAGHF